MTVYNKLKTAILAIIASQTTHAILIDPIQIQSAPGELLYAEMNFSQADLQTPIQVELANSEDLMTLGIQHRPPENLNFFMRRSGKSSGVIVITSSRPLTENELNFVVKIKEGNSTRLQHIQTKLLGTPSPLITHSATEKPLKPQIIFSEKDIALNLPVTTAYTVPTPASSTSTVKDLDAPANGYAISVVPPLLATPAPQPQPEQQVTSASASEAAPNKGQATSKTAAQPKAKSAAKKEPASKTANPSATHIVSNNESLWTIAARIAAQTDQSIPQVMKDIQAKNQHAFIQGDANRLRRGAELNLSTQVTEKSRPSTPVKPSKSSKNPSSGTAKYRINQAEMSLVAESAQDSAQGSAKKRTQHNQTSAELSLKVMTAREKTVKLQKNVTQLELALRQKDQRIQLLNARLAQLQQQLQQQQKAKKSIH